MYCLQYDDHRIISGLRDNTIKVGLSSSHDLVAFFFFLMRVVILSYFIVIMDNYIYVDSYFIVTWIIIFM